MIGQKKIAFLSIAVISGIVFIGLYRNFKKDEIKTQEITSSPNGVATLMNQENVKESGDLLQKESENKNTQQTPVPAPALPAIIVTNTKNSIGMNTRLGYDSAVNLLKNKGDFELRDMIFTKYFSEADKGKSIILFTFYLTNKNKEIQVKYFIKKNKAIIYLEYDLNNSKEVTMASVLGKTIIPQTAIDFGFEKAIAKIETNEDYLKIPNRVSNFPWVSFHNSPDGWEFQTMVDAKGSTGNKERYSFSVNLEKNQVFFERRF